MSKNLRRGPATPGLRQTIGAATRAAAAPKVVARRGNEPTVTRLDSDSLAAHQSDTPANNSTGKPTTPTEAGDPFHDDGKASRGAVQRTSTEDLTTDSPLKDEANDGVSTPSDMDLGQGREEETKPGSPMVEGAVMNWFDELGS